MTSPFSLTQGHVRVRKNCSEKSKQTLQNARAEGDRGSFGLRHLKAQWSPSPLPSPWS